MGLYAEGTEVAVTKTRGEVETLLRRYGADQFVSGWSEAEHAAMVQFRAKGRSVKIILKLPPKDEKRFKYDHNMRLRSDAKRVEKWQEEERRLWRALLLVIKSKLESVASGIESFEEAFLPWIMLPDGSTVGRKVAPLIKEAYDSGAMPKLLLLGPGPG